MITVRRVVLVAKNYEVNALRNEFNYEAIKVIESINEVELTWSCNKTPLIREEDLTNIMKLKYPILYLPDFIFGEEDFIHFCHKNGFECGERAKRQKFDTSKERCFLCNIAAYGEFAGSTIMYNQYVNAKNDMIMYESSNFFVKIELGCMVRGMVMICPKYHVLSMANLPDEQMDEYLQVMKDVEFLLKSIFGDKKVIFFEHGSSPTGFSSHQSSIVHAHLHCAWGVQFKEKYINMVSLKPIKDIREAKDTKYLSYQDGTEGKLLLVNNPNVYVQRQYPRQVIGEMIGIPNEKTNWRFEPFTENMNKTFDKWFEFLKQNSNFLSERIVVATECFLKSYPMRDDYKK